MHIKEGRSCAHEHLKNSIRYILDVKHDGRKAGNGSLVGGNSGMEWMEVLSHFLSTKRRYEKMSGRQGYHFVLSFAKGEADEETAYETVKEFCEAYLGDSYDYVFAIHNDKEHMHGHIIFNSVSRENGYKYHYKKGDWEKYIQPVTDRACTSHGLPPLTFEKEARTGTSYAAWAAEHGNKYNWTHIIQADVDFAVQQAETMEEFQAILGKMGYKIRTGYSKKHGKEYFTYKFCAPDGKEHRRRSYNMPPGYGPKEIADRILTKEGERTYEEVMKQLSQQASGYLISGILKNTRTYVRLYQAVSYYSFSNPYAVPAYRVRKDMLRLDKLIEQCRYLKENGIYGKEDVQAKLRRVKEKILLVAIKRRALYGIQEQLEERQIQEMERYFDLQEQKRYTREKSAAMEEVEREMEQMEAKSPQEILKMKGQIEAYRKELAGLKKEERLLKEILDTETEAGFVKPEPGWGKIR